MSWESGIGWCTARDFDAEIWSAIRDSRDEAIAEGRGLHGNEDFFVQKVRVPAASDFVLADDVDRIIGSMDVRSADAGKYEDSDFPDLGDAAKEELLTFIKAWADKHCAIDFWIPAAEDIERIAALPEEADEAEESAAVSP